MSRYQPTTLGERSLLGRRELLTSQRDDDVIHACYPTALSTLCGLDAHPDPRGETPDCPTCVRTAVAFDAIDKSTPDHWFLDKAAA